MDFDSDDESWMVIKNLIHDWGVSHTSLEEVFMKVIHSSNKQNLEDIEQVSKKIEFADARARELRDINDVR